ncbi:hypothetical protein B0J11DRAFT_536033 [Dendryphion nanum]|uniref:MARVEL domain-containing protein n=1 Tax=Dendryphion nanum TaxID=256645 RepID=A0A9P9DHN2_9PLEO|nr:hypothetical protein B0J11DRAFT_536033 [Dendryphion nanum]
MVAISPAVFKVLLSGSHLLAWLSSAIVTGITAYFLNNYAHDLHLIYEICISAIFLAFWIPSFVLPFFGTYRAYYLPLNFVFSYLWLTSFIFSAQDYNTSSCWANSPATGHCTLKLTNEAFIFLAFFFTLVAFIVDIVALKATAPVAAIPEKEVRPSGETAA